MEATETVTIDTNKLMATVRADPGINFRRLRVALALPANDPKSDKALDRELQRLRRQGSLEHKTGQGENKNGWYAT